MPKPPKAPNTLSNTQASEKATRISNSSQATSKPKHNNNKVVETVDLTKGRKSPWDRTPQHASTRQSLERLHQNAVKSPVKMTGLKHKSPRSISQIAQPKLSFLSQKNEEHSQDIERSPSSDYQSDEFPSPSALFARETDIAKATSQEQVHSSQPPTRFAEDDGFDLDATMAETIGNSASTQDGSTLRDISSEGTFSKFFSSSSDLPAASSMTSNPQNVNQSNPTQKIHEKQLQSATNDFHKEHTPPQPSSPPPAKRRKAELMPNIDDTHERSENGLDHENSSLDESNTTTSIAKDSTPPERPPTSSGAITTPITPAVTLPAPVIVASPSNEPDEQSQLQPAIRPGHPAWVYELDPAFVAEWQDVVDFV